MPSLSFEMKEVPSQGKKSHKNSLEKIGFQLPRNTKHKVEKSHGHPNIEVHGHPNRTIELMGKVQNAAPEKQLCYPLVSAAMVNVADGAGRALKVDPIAYPALKKGFREGKQYDVGETLAVYNRDLDFLTVSKAMVVLKFSNEKSSTLVRPHKFGTYKLEMEHGYHQRFSVVFLRLMPNTLVK